MSFRDYANHLLQKFRLAAAIAIIKCTPENSTPITHLESLREKIISEMESYDPDLTICEDDFNFDDDDDCINNGTDIQIINDHNAINETQFIDSQTNDSVTILKDFDFNKVMRTDDSKNDKENENNSVSNVLEILKGVENEDILASQVTCGYIDPSQNLNHTQSTYCVNSQSLLQIRSKFRSSNPESLGPQKEQELSYRADNLPRKDFDKRNEITENTVPNTEDATFYDSQQTILYTLHGFTDNYTHISQSQTDNIVVPRHLLSKKEFKDNNSKSSVTYNNSDLKNLNNNRQPNLTNQLVTKYDAPAQDTVKIIDNLNLCINNNETFKNNDILKSYDEQIHSKIAMDNTKQINYKKQKNTRENLANHLAKRLKTDNSVNCYVDKAYFDEIKRNFNSDNNGMLDIELIHDTKIINSMRKELDDKSLRKDVNGFNSDIDIIDKQLEISTEYNFTYSQNSSKSNTSRNVSKIAYNRHNFSQFSQEFDSEDALLAMNKENFDKNTPNDPTKELGVNKSEEEREELFERLTDSQTEVVTFKVLEELNKVKSFLNRHRRNSTDCVSDSGYKSDSQSRSSFKTALQSSNIWLNQSAHTLMTFIIRCPLVVSTAEITNEISRTLGLLIDRLHLEEKYPSFLEEYLEASEVLLNSIFEEELVEDQLLKKDENIHRLLLLNKSSHIITFTIEKIVTILENLHSKLLSEEILEITNTVQLENLPYIFHILETLIKKLLIFKNVSSQNSTQNSHDEEPILKKSSITDIWRKKWNFSKEPIETNIPTSKECVLVQCSKVLNKIIVDAMEGYSLISFYALQCFNLLQN